MYFKDFSRLENDQTFFHTFPDSVGTLVIAYFYEYCVY